MNKELFTNLIGKVLKINRGGPESRTGVLLYVSDDHLAILTDQEGVIYYKISHIKSITENVKKGFEFKVEVPLDFSYKTASNFNSLLDELKNQWVKINRGGPEKLEGILCDINDEFVTVFFNEEVIRLALFHIRSISYGEKVEKAKEDENEKAENNQDKNADKNSDKNSDKNEDKKSKEKKK